MTATPYPLINQTTFTSFPNILSYANMASSTYLGLGILLSIIMVVFLATPFVAFDKRLLLTSFIGMVAATLLTAAGTLANYFAPTLLAITVIIWILTKE